MTNEQLKARLYISQQDWSDTQSDCYFYVFGRHTICTEDVSYRDSKTSAISNQTRRIIPNMHSNISSLAVSLDCTNIYENIDK